MPLVFSRPEPYNCLLLFYIIQFSLHIGSFLLVYEYAETLYWKKKHTKQNNLSFDLSCPFTHHPISLSPSQEDSTFSSPPCPPFGLLQWACVPIIALWWLLSRSSQIFILIEPMLNSLSSFYWTSQPHLAPFWDTSQFFLPAFWLFVPPRDLSCSLPSSLSMIFY